MTSYDGTVPFLPDIYHFNINSTQSFKIVSRTPQYSEAL